MTTAETVPAVLAKMQECVKNNHGHEKELSGWPTYYGKLCEFTQELESALAAGAEPVALQLLAEIESIVNDPSQTKRKLAFSEIPDRCRELVAARPTAQDKVLVGNVSDLVTKLLCAFYWDGDPGYSDIGYSQKQIDAMNRVVGLLRVPPPASVPDGWLPIESAPKSVADGQSVGGVYLLGYVPDADVADPAACIDIIWWEPLMPNNRGSRGKWCASKFGDDCEVLPTHWKPLSAPPTKQEGAAP